MNKRLLLSLYDQSGLGAYMPVDLKGHELQVEEHMEKFADLILFECIKLAVFKGDKATAQAIKEHFEVQ